MHGAVEFQLEPPAVSFTENFPLNAAPIFFEKLLENKLTLNIVGEGGREREDYE